MFSVGVRRKSAFLTAFARSSKAYIVEAATARKAENAVKRYLKDQHEVEVFEAIPAEQLPMAVRVRYDEQMQQTQSRIPCVVEKPRLVGGGTITVEREKPRSTQKFTPGTMRRVRVGRSS